MVVNLEKLFLVVFSKFPSFYNRNSGHCDTILSSYLNMGPKMLWLSLPNLLTTPIPLKNTKLNLVMQIRWRFIDFFLWLTWFFKNCRSSIGNNRGMNECLNAPHVCHFSRCWLKEIVHMLNWCATVSTYITHPPRAYIPWHRQYGQAMSSSNMKFPCTTAQPCIHINWSLSDTGWNEIMIDWRLTFTHFFVFSFLFIQRVIVVFQVNISLTDLY